MAAHYRSLDFTETFLETFVSKELTAADRAAILKALRLLAKPRPAEAPPGYPIWPRWFSVVSFIHNRRFGNLFILGVALDTAVRLVFPEFWR